MRTRHHPRHRPASSRAAIWGVVSLAALALAWLVPAPARAAGVPDLMPNIDIGEKTLNDPNIVRQNNACGVAAAAMIVDYYQTDYQGPDHLPTTSSPATIDDAARYVPIHTGEAHTSVGTYPAEVQSGLEAAEAVLNPTVPLTAAWKRTDADRWLATLQAELDHRLPMILFIPNGYNLGLSFTWGHFIVVSGYTGDGSVIYHDPWKGATYTKSEADFATAWGTPFEDPRNLYTYYYLEILPPGVTSPVSTPTSASPSVPTPATQPHTVLAVGKDMTLASYDATTGKMHWSFAVPGPGDVAMIEGVTHDTVVVASVSNLNYPDGPLFGIDLATGHLRWQSAGGPTILTMRGNRIYLQGQGLIALDAATGKQLWAIGATPANGGFYATDDAAFLSFPDPTGQHSVLEAVSASTGGVLWQHNLATTPPTGYSIPVAGQVQAVDDNRVFVASSDSSGGPIDLEAFDVHTGARAWIHELAAQGQVNYFRSLIAAGGTVVVEVDTGELASSMTVLSEQTGQPTWSLPVDCRMTVPYLANSTVYIYCENQSPTDLYALHISDGSIRWRQSVPSTVAEEASNAVVAVQGGEVFYQTCIANFDDATVSCKLIALDDSTDAIRWQSQRQFWGVVGTAAITSGGAELAALAVQDGSTLWSDPLQQADSFGTSVVIA